jgi:DNA-binding phage protein
MKHAAASADRLTDAGLIEASTAQEFDGSTFDMDKIASLFLTEGAAQRVAVDEMEKGANPGFFARGLKGLSEALTARGARSQASKALLAKNPNMTAEALAKALKAKSPGGLSTLMKSPEAMGITGAGLAGTAGLGAGLILG